MENYSVYVSMQIHVNAHIQQNQASMVSTSGFNTKSLLNLAINISRLFKLQRSSAGFSIYLVYRIYYNIEKSIR